MFVVFWSESIVGCERCMGGVWWWLNRFCFKGFGFSVGLFVIEVRRFFVYRCFCVVFGIMV